MTDRTASTTTRATAGPSAALRFVQDDNSLVGPGETEMPAEGVPSAGISVFVGMSLRSTGW